MVTFSVSWRHSAIFNAFEVLAVVAGWEIQKSFGAVGALPRVGHFAGQSTISTDGLLTRSCAVCTKVITDIRAGMPKADIKSKPKVEGAIDKYCSQRELGPREKKICYYIEPIKRDVA